MEETGSAANEMLGREELRRILNSWRDPRNSAHRKREKIALREKPYQKNKSEPEKGSPRWEHFKSYYREQLRLPDEELDLFFRTMQTPLPVAFRLVLPTGVCGLVMLMLPIILIT